MDDFKSLKKIQMDHFIDTLEACQGSRARTADALGFCRKSVQNWLERAIKEGRKLSLNALHGNRGAIRRESSYKLETMLIKSMKHISKALTITRGNRLEAARLLECSPKTIYNYIQMAEFEKANHPFIGHRKEKISPRPTISMHNPPSADDIYYPMPTNEERLYYLDNPEAKAYNKGSFQRDH